MSLRSTTWGNMNLGNCVFSVMLYTVSRKQNGYARNNICTLYLIIRPYCLQTIILTLVDACRRYIKIKPKQCRFRDMLYSITEKTQFLGFMLMFPQVVQKH